MFAEERRPGNNEAAETRGGGGIIRFIAKLYGASASHTHSAHIDFGATLSLMRATDWGVVIFFKSRGNRTNPLNNPHPVKLVLSQGFALNRIWIPTVACVFPSARPNFAPCRWAPSQMGAPPKYNNALFYDDNKFSSSSTHKVSKMEQFYCTYIYIFFNLKNIIQL